MLLIRAPAIALLAVLLAGPGLVRLEAQRPPPVHVYGLIIDDRTGEPISGADLLILDSFGDRLATRVTDEHGRFEVEVRRAPGVRIRASRIGYRETLSPVLFFDDHLRFNVELRLDTDAVLLAPLEVVARSTSRRSPLFSNFDHRTGSGFGSYFTREEIEQIRPMRVSDLLVRLPGVHLEGSGAGRSRTVLMARSRALTSGDGGGCAAQIFVDGRLMNRGGLGGLREVAIDDLVTPDDVEGVEVYQGLSSVPAEFFNPGARCGVVAIWTRRAR
jgi:hypothetical protein